MILPPVFLVFAVSTAETNLAKPEAAWSFNSTLGYCIAQQLNGSDEGIRILRTPASVDTRIVIFDPAKWGDHSDADYENATVRIGADQTYLSTARAGPARSTATRFSSILVIDPDFLSRFSAASSASVWHPKFGLMSVNFRASALATDELRKCEDMKMTAMGIDPVVWRSLQRPPQPLANPEDWIRPEWLRLSGSGYSQAVIRVNVLPDGTVKNCTGLDPSIPTLVNQAACVGLKKRGRFRPALDSHGQPVEAPFVIVEELRFRSS